VQRLGEALGGDLFFSPDVTFELAVLDARFVFWQYHEPAECPSLPGPGASDAAIYAALDGIVSFASYSRESLDAFAPYFYQASTQLGAPGPVERHLEDLVLYPGQSVVTNLPPEGVDKPFDPGAMADVSAWLSTTAERTLFLYGENDPWTAGAFEPPAGHDLLRLVAPASNHGADLSGLTPADRELAFSALTRWLGIPVGTPAAETPYLAAWRALRRAPPHGRRP
jgi:PS-10 peptidase S37